MEVVCSEAVIVKNISVPNFSTYKDVSEQILSNLEVHADNLRTSWKLEVHPMQQDHSMQTSSISCDVGIALECTFSTAPKKYMREIQIFAWIQGRENYPVELKLSTNHSLIPAWKNVLISRVALKACKVASGDVFQFRIRFIIPQETIRRSYDGQVELAKDMSKFFGNSTHCDVCLVTVAGTRIAAHSAVLHARSNIMTTCKLISKENYHETFHPEEASDNELISSQEASILTPQKDETRLSIFDSFVVRSTCPDSSKCESPSLKHKQFFNLSTTQSPRSPITSDRKRSASCSQYKFSSREFQSPSKKLTQTPLTNYFPRSSLSKNETDILMSPSQFSQISKPVPEFSPIKKYSFSPAKSLRMKSVPDNDSRKGNPVLKTPVKEVRTCSTRASSSTILGSPFRSFALKKVFDASEMPPNMKYLKVNMSNSVTSSLVEWIYQGETSKLVELACPLLIAALRHEVPSLFEACQLELSSTLIPENTPRMLFLSYKYNASILKDEAMLFALNNASSVTSLDEWEELSNVNQQIIMEFTRKLSLRSSAIK